MKKLYLLFLLSPLFAFTQTDSILIHFNNLNDGDLNGQDGWKTINNTTGPSDLIVALAVGNVVTPDGTNGIYYNASGAGFGRTGTKKDFGDFELNLANGGILELEAEVHRNWWGEHIGIGHDADGDGLIAPGLATEPNDGGLFLALAAVNFPAGNKLVTPSGNAYGFDVDNGGWVKYKLFINLNGNGGEGQAALFYKTPPFDMDWVAVSDIQGVNLGLTPGSGDSNDPAMWDGLFLHSQGGTGFFDNIILRRPGGNSLTSQFIDFPEIKKQLTTTPPIQLIATADSGLPVEFEIVSGPASINGTTLTMDGTEGMVEVRASQPGDGAIWAAATPVTRIFQVIDPLLYSPELLVRNPVDQKEVTMPELSAFMMVASTFIEHDDVLAVEEVTFSIDGQNLIGKDWGTGYYTAWWTPPAYGSYTLTVTSKSTEGTITTESATFEVINLAEPLVITILDAERAGVADTNIVLPSYVGSFDNVKIHLEYNCPPEGCEPWDRVNQQEVQGPTGEWFGFMRYITPYGVACSDVQDITDYMSLFQGMVRVKLPYEFRSLITLRLEYSLGAPDYKYSWVDEIWDPDYAYSFGNPTDLQPVPVRNINLMGNVEDARLKIINSGHNWGENNTGNAAEFYEATHNINIDGNTAFTQHLWEDCNPNPAGCSPQNGTWTFNRAGWCPGALVPVWDFDLSNYVDSPFELQYEFDPGYTDFCHPNNPNCQSGLTCPDCSSSSNPILVVDAHMVSFSNTPLDGALTSIKEAQFDLGFSVTPNPNSGQFNVFSKERIDNADLKIINSMGQSVYVNKWSTGQRNHEINLNHLPKGVYWLVIKLENKFDRKKIIVQ